MTALANCRGANGHGRRRVLVGRLLLYNRSASR